MSIKILFECNGHERRFYGSMKESSEIASWYSISSNFDATAFQVLPASLNDSSSLFHACCLECLPHAIEEIKSKAAEAAGKEATNEENSQEKASE